MSNSRKIQRLSKKCLGADPDKTGGRKTRAYKENNARINKGS